MSANVALVSPLDVVPQNNQTTTTKLQATTAHDHSTVVACNHNLLEEMTWLPQIVNMMDSAVRERLVAHRGFHCKGNCLGRPLENTLQAIESAWASGVGMCECDITSTSDGHIVLCHDNNIARLALNPYATHSSQDLHVLKFSELAASLLKNGVRPPLLDEVLLSASRIGPSSQLVVEIKHGVPTIGTDLANFFLSQPHHLALLQQVCVVMSFDPRPLHDFLAVFASHNNHTNIKMPRVLVLTRTVGRPLKSFESWMSLTEPWIQPAQPNFTGGMFAKPNTVLTQHHPNGLTTVIDGVYAQFDPLMIGEHKHVFEAMCKEMVVGVWDVPDTHACLLELVSAGAAFVNSDLPNNIMT